MHQNLGYEFFSSYDIGDTPDEFTDAAGKFSEMMCWYDCAIKEIRTKLEVLNEEFKAKKSRNPIESIRTRVKTPMSIYEKMERRGYEITLDSIMGELHDIAGVRVICPFIDDIYMVSEMITRQDDITVLERKDYIKHPKPNGYRSLHLVLQIPVFLSTGKRPIKVEVQIRTMAMDFWASLEHQIHYKKFKEDKVEIVEQLLDCATVIYETDLKMQSIHKELFSVKDLRKEYSVRESEIEKKYPKVRRLSV
ncbi:MAG: GTP pyrophosphokinase family protein [Lachnospiraceae bacterium]|nr:GTP pyrophosphokinase family protein [Lachnospiraceae bacterium]